ncbi:MAG: SoxR reducing system RseC family protein [Pseudomonadota bacterium]
MPEYEGIVTKIDSKGDVEVLIRPENAGIIGASRLKVCHSASESSGICVKAENDFGAKVGDRVRIRRDAGALLRNLKLLGGLPLLGLLAGISVSVTFNHFLGISVLGQVLLACLGLVLGALAGTFLYRRTSGDLRLVITQVIQEGALAQPLTGEGLSCFESETRACEGCVVRRGTN